ncbi:DUF1365 domain-containing protein [Shewanella pneumatophori]|uniref:DUF1365 domain-containing protein n=1 Tax=Shewanella pneumatophori TaxID=314092 RepID=A0A9X1ZG47_9GAMM|nr:DUF1365 domain-containing protein [Shewanella pneumatophori]MCL1138790.1 DUF1365 domain-containing protein [Shewanella pneumatophori]
MSSHSLINDEFVSGVYIGNVAHKRYQPSQHAFNYSMAMLGIDLDELERLESVSRVFSSKRVAPLRFKQTDYLSKQTGIDPLKDDLKARVLAKAQQLGAKTTCNRVVFVGQVRHFGIYFSPINCFFCYQDDDAKYLLAEVSNTPWNERHYYLIDLENTQPTDKAFHVSPFMDLNMKYIWRVMPPADKVRVGIENRSEKKLFDANLCLDKQQMSAKNLRAMLISFPFMTLRIVQGIYWQALKLFIKRVPFIGHPGKPAEKI